MSFGSCVSSVKIVCGERYHGVLLMDSLERFEIVKRYDYIELVDYLQVDLSTFVTFHDEL